MEDLPVGSEITLNVDEDKKGECNGCFFYDVASEKKKKTCTGFKCGSTERKEDKNINFKRVK